MVSVCDDGPLMEWDQLGHCIAVDGGGGGVLSNKFLFRFIAIA